MHRINVHILIACSVGLLCGSPVRAEIADTVGVVSRVDVSRLSAQPEMQLSNAMQGRAAGLVTIAENGAFGEAVSSFYVRGQHRSDNNEALVLVDGSPRSLDEVLGEEIESIQVLKDAAAKIIYGSLATNGVILITTKRGRDVGNKVKVSAEYGVSQITRLPAFLGAGEYAALYNEAAVNDGLSPYYSEADLLGYQRSQGPDDPLYPAADYYGTFLKDNASFRRAAVQMNGVGRRVGYSLLMGYTGATGLVKTGVPTDLNRLNLRANLDVRVTDYLRIEADVASRIFMKSSGIVSDASLFGDLSTLRPNEYTFKYEPKFLSEQGLTVDEESLLFGASDRRSNNLYMQMAEGGNSSQRIASSEANLGFIFDFNEYVPGLAARVNVLFDNYTSLTQAMTNTYQTFMPERYLDAEGALKVRFTQKQQLNLPKRQAISSSGTYRYLVTNANVSYQHLFGRNRLNLDTFYKYAMREQTGSNQDLKNMDMSLRAQFAILDRYVLQGVISGMGSNRFQNAHKFFLAYSLGASWVLSNEEFLRGSGIVDHLALKASYGHLGYDGATAHYLYRTNWRSDGNVSWRQSLSTGRSILARVGNPDLEWEYSDEWNVGLEGRFLGDRLHLELNAFSEDRKNIIGIDAAKYSAVAGEFVPYENVGRVRNRGIDGALSWRGGSKDGFSYSAGVNMTLTRNALLRTTAVLPEEDYLNPVGKPTSTLFGLQAAGLFGKDVTLAGHAPQMFGDYGAGDIAYDDLNNDGVIDSHDRKSLGQSFPTGVFGLDFSIGYKGLNLYVLGTAETGLSQLLTNAFYWNYGQNAYSVLAQDRYHPTANPGGKQPRLTTGSGSNNFCNSSFWAADGSFFRLKNVELSYTLKGKGAVEGYRFFVRGANLFVLSKIKDLDPELIDAGVKNSPVLRTVTGGVSLAF